MGTEVAISFSTLRTQLENEKSSLFKIDENIKKIVQTSGRFQNDRFNNSGDYNRGGPRQGGRNSFPDTNKNDDQFNKRKHETKTVFSRLSARTQDSDGEEEVGVKRARVVSAVSRELPSRADVLRAQGGAAARDRNRRIFGSLLGTLQKFKQEEIGLQTKEDKKAQVERKIEEQARLEKEREQKERKSLFAERHHKKATIKALEAKMGRLQEFERWEASQKSLSNFILTKAKPHVYWMPKKMSEKAAEKLYSSQKFHEKCMTMKRLELQDELVRIEQRCLRPRPPGAKENDPETPHDHHGPETPHDHHGPETPHDHHGPEDRRPRLDSEEVKEGGRRRDKFAMDVDKDREDSDGEERHEVTVKNEEANDDIEAESQMDTSVEQGEEHVKTDESTKPIQTDEPSEPSQPHGPVEPTQPHGPVEPTQQHGPVEPTQPHGPVEPTQPHGPVEPSQLHGPVEPTPTHGPVEPSEPYGQVDPPPTETMVTDNRETVEQSAEKVDETVSEQSQRS